MCPGSSYQYYIVSYYIKWVTTSWTYGSTEFCSKNRNVIEPTVQGCGTITIFPDSKINDHFLKNIFALKNINFILNLVICGLDVF